MNYVTVLGYNKFTFDMNFLINILYDPPNHHVESIIGNLIYFKQVTVRTADGTCLKFLDVMKYVKPQTLKCFVKTFSNKKNLQNGVFENDRFNSSNFMEVLNQTILFEEQDFNSNLKNSDISEDDYNRHLVEWKEKEFETRWDYLKYYSIKDVKIMISPIDNLIATYHWFRPLIIDIQHL
jgi:hypothetical protein